MSVVQQQQEREWVLAIRGKFEERIMCEVPTKTGVLSLVAFGYENYPEPSFFGVALDGMPLRNEERVLYTDYFDTEVIQRVADAFPTLEVSKLMQAVSEMDTLPW